MAVGTETEVDEVEERWRSCDVLESQGVLPGCSLQVGRVDRHGMDLLRAQRDILKKAFAQVGEISVRMSIRGHTLVDLTYMHTRPGDIFPCQHSQHDPRSVTYAN